MKDIWWWWWQPPVWGRRWNEHYTGVVNMSSFLSHTIDVVSTLNCYDTVDIFIFWRFADRASQYLTNLMYKICFTVSFISCLYMFRAHVLIIRRSKLHYTASGIITPVGGRLVHETVMQCVMQFWPDDEHMCSKHVEAWNKTYCETNFVHTCFSPCWPCSRVCAAGPYTKETDPTEGRQLSVLFVACHSLMLLAQFHKNMNKFDYYVTGQTFERNHLCSEHWVYLFNFLAPIVWLWFSWTPAT